MRKRIVYGFLLVGLIIMPPVQAREVFLIPDQGAAAPAASAKKSATVDGAKSFMQTFQLKYLRAKDMGETVKGLFAGGETVTFNELINTIIVRADQKTIENLVKIIEKLDVPPLQVQVEAKIIELKNGSGDSTNTSVLGMEWKYTKNANNFIQLKEAEPGTTTPLGLYAELLSGNTAAYLSALEKSVGYDLIASPWITALNHREAEILIGSKYGYKTSIISQTSTVQQINFLEVGTKLKFTPHITEDGYIVMNIYPSVSEGSVTNELPQENTTETQNQVLVKDGQTIVIGGLSKNYNNQVEIGIPVLSQIPWLGNLFKRTELRSEKKEIMILITPHIVTPEFLQEMAEKAKIFEELRNQKGKEQSKLINSN